MYVYGFDEEKGQPKRLRINSEGELRVTVESVSGIMQVSEVHGEYQGGEALTVSTTPVSATIPTGCRRVLLYVKDSSVYYRVNGTASTDGPGYLPEDTGVILSLSNLQSLSFVSETSVKVFLQYMK